MSIIKEQTRIEEAKKEHNSTIIFFHGMTLNNNCVGHFDSNMQENFPHTKFIFLQASRKEWAVEGMFSCSNKETPTENTNWYCIEGERDHLFTPNPPKDIREIEEWAKDMKINEVQLKATVVEVHKIIQTEINKGIKPENIVVAGYSQGGSAALATGLTFEKPLGGIVSLSSFLPWIPIKTYFLVKKASLAKKKIPIIFCNGTDDGLVPFWTGKMSVEILKLCGYSKVEFHGYQGQGHSTNCDKELNNFLEGILPKKRKKTEEENGSDDFPKSKKPKNEEPVENKQNNEERQDKDSNVNYEQLVNEIEESLKANKLTLEELPNEIQADYQKINKDNKDIVAKITENVEKQGAEKRFEKIKIKVNKLSSLSKEKLKKLKEKMLKIINSSNKYDECYKKEVENLLVQLGESNEQIQQPKLDNNFPTNWIIGGVVLLAIGGLVIFLVVRNQRRGKTH